MKTAKRKRRQAFENKQSRETPGSAPITIPIGYGTPAKRFVSLGEIEGFVLPFSLVEARKRNGAAAGPLRRAGSSWNPASRSSKLRKGGAKSMKSLPRATLCADARAAAPGGRAARAGARITGAAPGPAGVWR